MWLHLWWHALNQPGAISGVLWARKVSMPAHMITWKLYKMKFGEFQILFFISKIRQQFLCV